MTTLSIRHGLYCAMSLFTLCTTCETNQQLTTPKPQLIYEYPQIRNMPIHGSWVGHLNGIDNVSIVPQVTGYIQEQLYENGSVVKKGQTLFLIDDTSFRAELKKAQATLEQAEANLRQLQYDSRIYEPLARANAISKQKYEDTRLATLAAEASVKEAKAELTLAQRNLSYTIIKAPFDGVAGFSTVNRGDLVSPDSKPLCIVSDVDPIQLDISITQQEWLKQSGKKQNTGIQLGSKLSINLHDHTNWPHKATVIAIDRGFNPMTGSLRIRAELPNPHLILRPGMFVIATALLQNIPNALCVPSNAIISTQGKNFVVTLDNKNHPYIVPVKVGAEAQGFRQISPIQPKAITRNSRIIIKGLIQAETLAQNPHSIVEAIPNKEQ